MKAESICPKHDLARNQVALSTLFAALLVAVLSISPGSVLAQVPSTSSVQAPSTSSAQTRSTGSVQDNPPGLDQGPTQAGLGSEARSTSGQIYIQEYRVEGTHKLSELEVEEAVYPYLGPGRTTEDVEHARAALEKAYQDKGYQTVSVQIPPQQVRNGVV